MRSFVLFLAICACDTGPELERLPAPTTLNPILNEQPPPPPPPPPGGARVERTGPPPEIANALGDAHDQINAWSVTLYELGSRAERGPKFMGLAIHSKHVLDTETAQRVVAQLRQKLYSDSDVGGFTDTSLGLRIANERATLELVYNDGHLFLTPALHDGPFVVIDGMWLEALFAKARRY